VLVDLNLVFHVLATVWPKELAGASVPERKCFQVVFIEPSHYDDDGYAIRWWRAMIPLANQHRWGRVMAMVTRNARPFNISRADGEISNSDCEQWEP
jgi:hypothetical protein